MIRSSKISHLSSMVKFEIFTDLIRAQFKDYFGEKIMLIRHLVQKLWVKMYAPLWSTSMQYFTLFWPISQNKICRQATGSAWSYHICVIFPFIGIKSYLYIGKIYQIGLNFWQHCLKRKKSSKQIFTFSTRPLSYLNNMWLTLKSKCYHWGYRVTKSSIFLSIEKVEKHPYFK